MSHKRMATHESDGRQLKRTTSEHRIVLTADERREVEQLATRPTLISQIHLYGALTEGKLSDVVTFVSTAKSLDYTMAERTILKWCRPQQMGTAAAVFYLRRVQETNTGHVLAASIHLKCRLLAELVRVQDRTPTRLRLIAPLESASSNSRVGYIGNFDSRCRRELFLSVVRAWDVSVSAGVLLVSFVSDPLLPVLSLASNDTTVDPLDVAVCLHHSEISLAGRNSRVSFDRCVSRLFPSVVKRTAIGSFTILLSSGALGWVVAMDDFLPITPRLAPMLFHDSDGSSFLSDVTSVAAPSSDGRAVAAVLVDARRLVYASALDFLRDFLPSHIPTELFPIVANYLVPDLPLWCKT